MKKLVMALAAVLVLATAPALAETKDQPMIPDEKQLEELRLNMLAGVAEAEGWCKQPKRKLTKKGDFAVDWSRDDKGRCVVQTLRTK